MYSDYQKHLDKILSEIREAGLYKNERIIVSPQGAEIKLSSGKKVLNFCANNYLGLSGNRTHKGSKVSPRQSWLRDVVGTVYLRYHRPS